MFVQGYVQRSDVEGVAFRTGGHADRTRALRRVTPAPPDQHRAVPERLPVIEFKISSFCSAGGCVEVGHSPSDDAVVVRDSKDPLRSVSITFGGQQWDTFLSGVRRGEFNAE